VCGVNGDLFALVFGCDAYAGASVDMSSHELASHHVFLQLGVQFCAFVVINVCDNSWQKQLTLHLTEHERVASAANRSSTQDAGDNEYLIFQVKLLQ
jgi:hypothetical protein